MSRRVLTVDRYKEIERLLAAGRGVREITRALKCSRRLVNTQLRCLPHGFINIQNQVLVPTRVASLKSVSARGDHRLGNSGASGSGPHTLHFSHEPRASKATADAR